MPISGASWGAKPSPKRKVGKISRQLRKYLAIDEQHTPNLLEVLSKLTCINPKFKIKTVPDEKFPKIEAWTNSHSWTIYITERVLKALLYGQPRARFTVAHEIGHLLLQHGKKQYRKPRKRYARDDKGSARPIIRKHEQEANKFASTFLMPSHLIDKSDTAEDISKKFRVSMQAARIRIEELKNCVGQEDFGWEEGTLIWAAKKVVTSPSVSPDREGEVNVEAVARTVFVAMDFDPQRSRFYFDVIKSTVEECGFQCCRGDELRGPGIVLNQIQRVIRECLIVIADISDFNKNVLMEVGMALSRDKPTVLICRDGIQELDVPYNMRHLRRLPYSDDPAGGVKLRRDLITALREILQSATQLEGQAGAATVARME